MTMAETKSDDKVTIYLSGVSHGGQPGDKRVVDKSTAERLVRSGLARYSK